DAPRAGDLLSEGARLRRLHELLVDDLAAERDALIADVDALPGDELAHLILALPAERAAVGLATLGGGRHRLAGRHRNAFLFLGFGLLHRLGDGDQRVLTDEDLIDDPVGLRLLRAHEAVALRVAADLLDVLARVVRENARELVDERLELLHLDEHVGGVAAESAGALVDHDPRVRQRVPLALRAGRDEHRGHRRRRSTPSRMFMLLARFLFPVYPPVGPSRGLGGVGRLKFLGGRGEMRRFPRSLVLHVAASTIYAAIIFLAVHAVYGVELGRAG